MRSPSAGDRRAPVSASPSDKPVDPEPAVGIEHHLDDGGVFQKRGDGRPERGAQHARTARDRFCLG